MSVILAGLTATQQFQNGVNALAATGMDRARATSQFVRTNPAIHAAMLTETQSRAVPAVKVPEMPLRDKPHTKAFMDKVHQLIDGGATHSAACCQVVRESPEMHRLMRAEAVNHASA